MSFAEHLEELRKCVLRSVVALVLVSVVCFFFQDELAGFVEGPYHAARAQLAERGIEVGPLVYIQVAEGWLYEFRIALYAGMLIAAPVFLYEMWRFVSAGLYPHERRAVMRVLPVSLGLFALGAWFAYDLLLPLALTFLLSIGDPERVQPQIRVEDYLGFFRLLCVMLGLIFQLPLIQVVLARFGLLSAAAQASKRRHFVLGAAIFAAVITPTGDAVTMAAVGLPMILLYEIGLLAARRLSRPAAAPGA